MIPQRNLSLLSNRLFHEQGGRRIPEAVLQRHAWAKRTRKENIDLGKGKRMLAKGGKLDPTYQITVPEDLVGLP